MVDDFTADPRILVAGLKMALAVEIILMKYRRLIILLKYNYLLNRQILYLFILINML